jgi:heme-degrading monooxygenase HmoA
MFPPPVPWRQLVTVDPDREYVAFSSRFFLRSARRVPAFISTATRIMKQANAAPGIIGWSLGADLLKLEFHTLSAWESADALRRFVGEGSHRAAAEAFERDLRRKSIFVYYQVSGRDLPLTWKDAIARQQRQDQG